MVVPAAADARSAALEAAENLRDAGLDVVLEVGGRSVRAALKLAHKTGVGFVVLLGEEEMASGRPTLRDMSRGEQFSVSPDEMVVRLQSAAAPPGEAR